MAALVEAVLSDCCTLRFRSPNKSGKNAVLLWCMGSELQE